MDDMAISPHFPPHNADLHLKYSTDSNGNAFLSDSSLTAVHHSDVKSFDVETDMAEALMPSHPNARPKHFRNAFEECVFVFTVMMCAASTTFLQGVTVINTATIGEDLNMTAAEITWISAALGFEYHSPLSFHTLLTSLQSLQRVLRPVLRKDRRSLRPEGPTPRRIGLPQSLRPHNFICTEWHRLECPTRVPRPWNSCHFPSCDWNPLNNILSRSAEEQSNGGIRLR